MNKPLNRDVAELGRGMLDFASTTDRFVTADKLMDGLHKAAKVAGVSVLVAALLPLRWGNLGSIEKGKTAILHESAPPGWFEDWLEMSHSYPGPGLIMARMSIAPYTNSEIMRLLDPVGTDRWPYELALKYGMRDGLTCPVGGRWIVAYWSRNILSQRLTDEARAILFMGATFAAIRLQQLIGPQAARIGEHTSLTPRELAVLRHLAEGHQVADVAGILKLGEETVRSHAKKAQAKLGARNRTHAVAEAIRRHLIV